MASIRAVSWNAALGVIELEMESDGDGNICRIEPGEAQRFFRGVNAVAVAAIEGRQPPPVPEPPIRPEPRNIINE